MISAGDTVDGGVGHRHDDDAMNMVESGVEISRSKPLSELTVGDVGKLLESIEFDEYKAVFAKNKIDGKCLMKCNTVEDAVSMGIPITVKASLLLDVIRKWKTTGAPNEYLSINPSTSHDDDQNADVKSLIVSYVPLTITHVILLYSTSHLSICVYTLIGCSIVSYGYFRSHVEWQASQTSL